MLLIVLFLAEFCYNYRNIIFFRGRLEAEIAELEADINAGLDENADRIENHME